VDRAQEEQDLCTRSITLASTYLELFPFVTVFLRVITAVPMILLN